MENNSAHSFTEGSVIWGRWSCPVCGVAMEDPSDIFETVCDNGHTVRLGIVQGNGIRETFEEERHGN